MFIEWWSPILGAGSVVLGTYALTISIKQLIKWSNQEYIDESERILRASEPRRTGGGLVLIIAGGYILLKYFNIA